MSDTLTQLELFTGPLAPTVPVDREPGRRDSGESRIEREATFGEFHERNPHVYRELVKLARFWRSKGRRRLSMKALFEVLRMRFVETDGGGQFVLNNNYTAPYARLLMDQEPDLAGLFELRERKASQRKGIEA